MNIELLGKDVKIDSVIHNANKKTAFLEIEKLSVFYGETRAVRDVTMNIPPNEVTAFIGPSGCGKSTLLKAIARLPNQMKFLKTTGSIFLDGDDILLMKNIAKVGSEIGFIFQTPICFPKSIFENVAYGLRVQELKDKKLLKEKVEQALRLAGLFDEVKYILHKSALELSGGQQQRVCIARALALEPKVLLMDEPTSALDPIATAKIEETIMNLKKEVTIILVTHDMDQAKRCADNTALFYYGQLLEYGSNEVIFTKPHHKVTEDYVTGKFG